MVVMLGIFSSYSKGTQNSSEGCSLYYSLENFSTGGRTLCLFGVLDGDFDFFPTSLKLTFQ